MRGREEDKLCCTPSKQRRSEVKSNFKALAPHGRVCFPWRSIWRPKVPSRVAFFLCTAALVQILAVDNMRKRHVLVINWCCMCKRSAKMVDHLVLHCSSARELWSMVFSLFGIQWTMPKGVTELLACW